MTTGLSSNLSFIRRAFLQKRVVVTPAHSNAQNSSWRRAAIIAVPYLWMILFFLVPFLIIFKIRRSGYKLLIIMNTFPHSAVFKNGI